MSGHKTENDYRVLLKGVFPPAVKNNMRHPDILPAMFLAIFHVVKNALYYMIILQDVEITNICLGLYNLQRDFIAIISSDTHDNVISSLWDV